MWCASISSFYAYCCYFILAVFLLINTTTLYAEELECGSEYTVISGDSLSSIAERVYKDSAAFRVIFNENKGSFSSGPSLLVVGQRLKIPCLSEEALLEKLATASENANGNVRTEHENENIVNNPGFDKTKVVELLTAGDYVPFTDEDLKNGGLIAEIVQKALASSGVGFNITWINDWSSHLDPLLKKKKFDMGFPWFYPGCPNKDELRCEFLFSQPVFELLISLFIKKDADFDFDFVGDGDLFGKRLCRPAGYFTHDLEREGREWLTKQHITLTQPKTVKECFDLLLAGDVDGVTINDFTGRETIARLGLQNLVQAAAREISKEGLSVIVHKSHPRSTILLNSLNNGLNNLHQSGTYEEILDRHLLAHWEKVELVQSKAADEE